MPSTLEQALAASAADQTERALELLRQASAEAPNQALPQFLLGAELAQVRRYTEAESAYASAVLLAPDFAIARYELGSLQFTSGRAALALVTWQPLLSQADTEPLKLFVMGYAALAQDDFAAAREFFQRGMAANSTNLALNGNIALLLNAIDQQQSANPESATQDSSHFLLGAYQRQGNPS